MFKNHIAGVSLFLLFGLVCTENALSQVGFSVQHQPPTVLERQDPAELRFELFGLSEAEIEDAFLFYKYDGEMSYRQVPARFSQGNFEVEIDLEDENAGMLEYYFSVGLVAGGEITYPASSPSADPVQVNIVESREQSAAASAGIDYTILSPDPGSTLFQDDVLIAITLFYEEGAVDTSSSSFSLLLDGKDMTDEAEASDFFFSYAPEGIDAGEHEVVVVLETPDETIEIAEWSFRVLEPGQVAASSGSGSFGSNEQQSSPWVPAGQAELIAQNREVGGIGNDVLRGNVRLSGSSGNVRYSAYGLITSEEDNRLQPQNRYNAELYVGDWFELQAGHIYPSMGRLAISGRRIQGINTSLSLLGGGVNAQFMYGKLNRKITNLYDTVTPEFVLQSDSTVVDTTYTLGFEQGGTGTYRRNLLGGRLSFGGGRNFQWGVNFLKVKDDTTSLVDIDDYTDLQSVNPALAAGLDQQYLDDLQANPGLLTVSGGPQPKDNLIAGTDLALNLFGDRLQLRSEGSISLLNEDISNGVLNDDNSLGIDVDEDVVSELDRWSWLIVINENMNTLPFKYEVVGDETNIEGFFPTGILANQSELNFNLPGNSFRLQYRWIGPDYVSLANSTIRRDVAGYTLTDRFRLLQNRLYVTLGYENLNDNVTGSKSATTNTSTVRTNVSWFPVDLYMPRVSVGLMLRNRDNDVSLFNPFVSDPFELAAAQNFEIVEGDTTVAASPRLTNTTQVTTSVSQQFNLFDLRHDASLSLSFLNTSDDYFTYGDTKNTSVNFTVRSQLPFIPMDAHFGFNVNSTETLGGLSEINVVGFNVGGSMFFLEERLNVNADLAFTDNKIVSRPLALNDNGTASDPRDDFFEPETGVVDETRNNLFIIRAGAQYDVNPNHAFLVNLSFTNVSSRLSGANPPNDHLLQARYIFRF